MGKFRKSKPFRTGKKPSKPRSSSIFSRSARRRASGAWSLAKAAWNGLKYVKGMINCEKHFLDTAITATQNYTGTVTALSATTQGDTLSNRIGNSILAKYLNLRYAWVMDAALSTTIARVMVFQDTMSLGTIPAPSDVLTTTGDATAVVSLLNLTAALQGRFKILYDKSVTMQNTGQQCHVTDEIIPINDHIKYTSTTGTDEGRNMLYVLCITSVNANLPTLSLKARLAFYDN